MSHSRERDAERYRNKLMARIMRDACADSIAANDLERALTERALMFIHSRYAAQATLALIAAEKIEAQTD